MKNFSIIIAVDNENGIGKCKDLAWKIPEDMKYFKNITSTTKNTKKKNALIMGRTTWESIPEKFRPLPGRVNCILSRSHENGKINDLGGNQYNSFDACLEALSQNKEIENIFVIGGAQLYNEIIHHPKFKKAYVTRIFHKYHCDTFFDGLPNNFDLKTRSEMKEYEGVEYEFSVYTKRISFLSKIKNIFKK